MLLAVLHHKLVRLQREVQVVNLDRRAGRDELGLEPRHAELGHQRGPQQVVLQLVGELALGRARGVQEHVVEPHGRGAEVVELLDGVRVQVILPVGQGQLQVHHLIVGLGQLELQLPAHQQVVLGVQVLADGLQQVHAALVHLASALQVLIEEGQHFEEGAVVLQDLDVVGHVAVHLEVFLGLAHVVLAHQEDGARLVKVQREDAAHLVLQGADGVECVTGAEQHCALPLTLALLFLISPGAPELGLTVHVQLANVILQQRKDFTVARLSRVQVCSELRVKLETVYPL